MGKVGDRWEKAPCLAGHVPNAAALGPTFILSALPGVLGYQWLSLPIRKGFRAVLARGEEYEALKDFASPRTLFLPRLFGL